MFHKSKLFFWTTEVLLLTIIFFIWRQMDGLISPFVSVLNTVLIPFLIAGFLYYVTNPLVKFLEKELKIKRIFGILITLVLLFGIIALGIIYLLPILITQLTSLISSSQNVYGELQNWINQLSQHSLFKNLNILKTREHKSQGCSLKRSCYRRSHNYGNEIENTIFLYGY